MNQVAFDSHVRRAVSLLERQSLFGGFGAALSTLSGFLLDAKVSRKRFRFCRAELLAVCEENHGCIDDLLGNCKKARKSPRRASECCENEHLADFRNQMRAIS